MMEFVTSQLDRIEHDVAPSGDRAAVLRSLRVLGLDDFGSLMFALPLEAYPAISRALPRMADEQIQRNWTGASGQPLLLRTVDFVRSVCYNYARYTNETFDDRAILDFGCGYGRIARLFYYFTDPSRFHGVDPWDESIRICAASGLTENFFQSDYLPTDLPTGATQFALIYAFSVFTHLSERATRRSLETLIAKLAPNGMLVITIRPVEYWDLDTQAVESARVAELTNTHRESGFAFIPHLRDSVDGDITYGDTSMSLDWIRSNFPGVRVMGIDRSLNDPYQIYVFLMSSDPTQRA